MRQKSGTAKYGRYFVSAMAALAMASAGERGQCQKADEKTSSELGAMFDQAVEKGAAPTRVMDRWFALYSHGKLKEADQVWAEILVQNKEKVDISELLNGVNERCWFGDSPGKGMVSITVFQYLLKQTEKLMGKEHRFVGDINESMGDFYEASHQLSRALECRKLDLKYHEKEMGSKNWKVIEAQRRLGHLLVKMKRYGEGEDVLKKCIAGARQTSNVHVMQSALPDYVKLLQAVGRVEEANRMRAEYMKWRTIRVRPKKDGLASGGH